jgi:hypothetical protein
MLHWKKNTKKNLEEIEVRVEALSDFISRHSWELNAK